MKFKTKRKTAVAFVLSMLILMLSVVYFLPQTVNAVDFSEREYIYCNYSTDPWTYDNYSLKLENANNINNLSDIARKGDYTLDNETAVVRIENVGGSGFIINEHTIVTAGHCVYNISNREFYDFTISITDAEGNVIKNLNPKFAHVPKAFADAPNKNHLYAYINDYAMIIVEEDLSEYGMFDLGVATNQFMENKSEVAFCGYPDFNNGNNWGKRYSANGNITDSNSSVIEYSTTTYEGMSGGPVYCEREYFGQTYKTIIAIHIRGGTGTRITSDLLKFYYSNPRKNG